MFQKLKLSFPSFRLFLGIALSISVSAGDLEDYIAQLSPTEVFELSRNGTLGKITAQMSTQTLNASFIRNVERSPWAMAPAANTRPHYPFPDRLLVSTHPGRITLTSDFKKFFRRLFEVTQKWNQSEIELKTIIAAADRQIMTRKKQKKIGGFYVGYKNDQPFIKIKLLKKIFYIPILNTFQVPFFIELPYSVQDEMERVFSLSFSEADLELKPHESKLLSDGALTLQELIELKLLRKATQLFLSNSAFASAPAGWAKNNILPQAPNHKNLNCPISAYCGEHSQTMLDFSNQLIHEGYLTQFKTNSIITIEYGIENHSGALLENRRNGDFYVLDSWAVTGSEEAKILPLKNWTNAGITGPFDKNQISSLPCKLFLR